MRIDSIIQTNADVARIVNLAEGDVYRRVITSNYSEPKIVVGVVRQILQSTDGTTVVGVEYEKSFTGVSVKEHVMTGQSDVMIYPATPEELREALNGFRDELESKVDVAHRDLERAQDALAKFEDTALALAAEKVQAPEVTTA